MEKGIKIADQQGGTAVAARDALEQTSAGVPRLIQLMDFASRSFTKTIHRSGVTNVDSSTLADADAMYAARITVGDKSTIVAHFDVTHNAEVPALTVTVTPVLYAADNSLVGILASKSTGIGDVALINAAGGGQRYILPALQWDLFGAVKVALHVTTLDKNGSINLNVYAEVL